MAKKSPLEEGNGDQLPRGRVWTKRPKGKPGTTPGFGGGNGAGGTTAAGSTAGGPRAKSAEPAGDADLRANRLLAALPARELERLSGSFRTLDATIREILYDVDEPTRHVWFPLSGVWSWITIMHDGAAVEVATVGNEGFVGLQVFLGAGSVPGQCFCQVDGRLAVLPARAFRDAVDSVPAFRSALQRYVQGLFNQIAQAAACNRLHSLEQRCARWVLLTHDRVEGDAFPLTQQFLAQMLGVRRAGVNEAARALQDRGLLRYNRGVVEILDRAGLEGASCECYGVIRREFDRLLGEPKG